MSLHDWPAVMKAYNIINKAGDDFTTIIYDVLGCFCEFCKSTSIFSTVNFKTELVPLMNAVRITKLI